MSISKFVYAIFLGAFVVAAVTLDKTFTWIWELGNWTNYAVPGLGRQFTITRVLALVGSIGFTFWLYRKPGAFAYTSEVVAELKKVKWPDMDETKRSTLIVIAFTIVLSGFLAVFDWIWKYLTDFIFAA